MDERLRILLIDDDEDEYFLLKEMVSGHQRGRTSVEYDLDWVSTYEEAVRAFSDCQYDLYLVDYRLAGRSGLDLLREPHARSCAAPIIMLTGQGNYEIDLAAMQLGAADYLEKSQLTLPLFERSIRYAIDRKRVEDYMASLLQERAQAVARLQKQAQEINALQKATSSLLNTLEISRLLGQILDAAREAIPSADQAWLHLVEQLNSSANHWNEMRFRDPRIRRIKGPDSTRNALKVLAVGQPLLIAEAQGEPLLVSLLDNEQDRAAVGSIIIAPLLVGHDVFGAISLSAPSLSVFTEGDLQLLMSFATTASAAIHNAVLYAETQSLATTDPLTGQLNRRTLFEFGQREMERFHRFGHHLSALMFDVDDFKEVNDTYGHSAGDVVLVTIADRCCKVIRHVDILGRYGGDEFVVLLPEADLSIASDIAERIRISISKSPMTTDAGPISVSISVGVAQATDDTDNLGDLLNRADQALYQAKQAGRNRTST